jgi:hypothetical protein
MAAFHGNPTAREDTFPESSPVGDGLRDLLDPRLRL